MQVETVELDAVIFGGGIAGLWTLNRLRRDGYAAVLLENRALGAGQTIASQGIIHGGVKYAIGGFGGDSSEELAAMPERWRACLAGEAEPDLSGARLLSERCLLWTTPGVGARLMGAAASRTIRTRPERLEASARPAGVLEAPAGVDVYAMGEPVVDPASVLGALADRHAGAVAATADCEVRLRRGDDGVRAASLIDADAQREVELRAGRLVLCAGAGNAELLGQLGPAAAGFVRMQRRPLHMVMARGNLPEVYGHCIGASPTPLLTITSAEGRPEREGERVWWIGGRQADEGIQRSAEEQIEVVRGELERLLPWLDFGGVRFANWRVDRAEAAQPGGKRPEGPNVVRFGNVIVCWPTKLALAPVAADLVASEMHETPRHAQPALAWVEAPPVAAPPWAQEGVRWS